MNIGTIVTPNTKGQIVIPKKVRDDLGIEPGFILNLIVEGNGIHIYPVEGVIAKIKGEDSRMKIWKETAGAWAGDDWPKTEKRRRRIELEASKRRKNAW